MREKTSRDLSSNLLREFCHNCSADWNVIEASPLSRNFELKKCKVVSHRELKMMNTTVDQFFFIKKKIY